MAETAALIIKVDSRGAKSATAELDKLTTAGGRSERAADSLARQWKMAGVAIGTAAAGGAAAFLKMAEAHQNITSRLRLATKGAEEFNRAYTATYDIAQRTGTAFDGVANLYARLAQSSTELGLSQADIAQVTETVTQAFIVSGASAQEASGGIRQLTQAMAGGTLRAEEFNSIIESSPRIVQALADHFGVSFGKVRQLVNDGKVSSEQFAQALITQAQAIRAEFDTMPVTVGRAMQEVRTALQRMAGQANESSGATDGLAEAIRGLARELESDAVRDGFASVVSGVSQIITLGTQAIGVLDRIGTGLQGLRGQAAGAEKMLGGLLYLDGDRIKAGWEQYRTASGTIDSAFRATPAPPPETHPGIDFTRGAPADYKPAPKATDGVEKRTKAVKELTEAEKAHRDMMEEIAAHEGVVESTRMEHANAELRRIMEKEEADARASDAVRQLLADMEFEASLIGMTAVEQEKMIALRYAGAAATDEQKRAIGELVERMEQASAQGEFKQDLKSLFVDVGMDIDNASSALDRFFDNLKRRALEALADAAIQAMFGQNNDGSKSTAGFWGTFANNMLGAWGGGRAGGGPVQGGQAYIVGENGPELFSPGQSGRVHPIGQAAQGKQTTIVNVEVVNNTGAEVQRETRQTGDGQVLERIIIGTVNKGFGRGDFDGAMGMFGQRRMGVTSG